MVASKRRSRDGRTGSGPTSLLRLTLSSGWWVWLLPPIAGLLVFWWMPFKPAVTVYAIIVGLGMALHSVVEEARMRREIEEIARRLVHEHDAR